MAVTLNASNSGTGGLSVTSDATGNLAFQTAGTTAVTVDTSQNVGIGTASLSAKLHLSTASASAAVLILNSTNNTPYMRFDESGGAKFIIGESSIVGGGAGYYDFYVGASVGQRFFTGAAERMRITSSGNFGIGTTTGLNSKVTLYSDCNALTAMEIRDTGTTGGYLVAFYNSASNLAGGIIHNGTTTVNYSTSSDYRMKENIAPMTGALSKVALLKPVTYKWKEEFGGESGQGFIAHELQAVVPEAVAGAKDALNEDGSIKPQGIDTSFLVATLTAAIQELKAEVDALKARLTP